jgi:hypothetical protein
VALAMDSRAFGAHERRTYLRRLRFAQRNLAFVALFWLGSLALVLLAHAASSLGQFRPVAVGGSEAAKLREKEISR